MIRICRASYKIILILFLSMLSTSVAAQLQEYKDYTVQKGDTLWDITGKELKDHFLWPKVWKENTDIKNPDRIYPNQKIRIPLHLMQKEIIPPRRPAAKPEIKPEIPKEMPVKIQPGKKDYLIDKNLLIFSGYITDSVHSVGTIYSSPSETSILTKGDLAYIKTAGPARKGDKFYIIYPVEEVKHPVTGRKLGVRIAILGIAELVDESDPKVLIIKSFSEIPIGSLLDNYQDIEPSLAPDNPRKPDIDAYIVSAFRRTAANGTWDVVFIDKGRENGIEIGDLLATTLQSEHKILNGVVQVISTKPSTSAAIIRKAAKEIQIGDPVIAIKQE